MRREITDSLIRSAAPKVLSRLEFIDSSTPSFRICLTKSGGTYAVIGRIDGKLVKRQIGSVPPASAKRGDVLPDRTLWPDEARKVATRWIGLMQRGVDPAPLQPAAVDARLLEVFAQRSAVAFMQVAQDYLSDRLAGGGAKLASRPELERKLKADLATWHYRPITEIKSREIRELIRNKAQNSPVAANRLLSFIKRVFKWAADQEIIDIDPAALVRLPSKENPRDRILDDDEIRLFWASCEVLGPPAGSIFKMLLLTGQRRGEVGGMRRSELGRIAYDAREQTTGNMVKVVGDAWMIPSSRTKRRVPHTVPLSGLAVQVLNQTPKVGIGGEIYDHIFCAGSKDMATKGYAKFRRRLDEQIGRIMAKEAGQNYNPEVHRLRPWHLHDLRATAATLMEARLDIPRHVVSRILNHAEGDSKSMTSRYIRHSYTAEMVDALNCLADEITRIVVSHG